MKLSDLERDFGQEPVAVEIRGVSKCFRLYHDVNQSLKEKIINWRKRGYDLFWALQDVDVDIRKGETISVIGPNGSGKSTLLRMMTRIMVPDRGYIKANGKIAALLDLGAGFHPDLTGRENIYLNASILGFTRREVDAIYDRIVEFSELGEFIDNQVKNYSSGMYVRLGFSVAINVWPDILLIDEVLAVGDEAFQAKCLDKINEFQEAGKTIVLVTHNSDLAAQISHRILWLEGGRVKMLGDPVDVVNEYHAAMRVHPLGEEFGNRLIRFTDVRLTDEEGRVKPLYRTGESMMVRLEYEAAEPVEDPIFGIGFYDHQGQMVYGTNTKLRDLPIPRVEGRGAVVFRIPHLSMLDGRYFLSVAACTRDYKTDYHWKDKFYFFDVKSPGKDSGYLTMDCEITWEGDA
jgi:ABC-type polysaccharide/polyol phosphate transport system ATPase subunit